MIDLPKGFEGSQRNLEELQGFQVYCKSADTPQTLRVKLSEIRCLEADLLQGLEGLQRSVSLSEVSQAVAKELHRVAFHSHTVIHGSIASMNEDHTILQGSWVIASET